MSVQLTIDGAVRDVMVGIVEARGVVLEPPGTEQVEQVRRDVALAVEQGAEGGDARRKAVRALLRHGGFKPSGRNKPAQEYLLRAASSDAQWPTILNAVDELNRVSLLSGLPISLLALNRLNGPLLVRYGAPGESFVFNQAGQILDANGLLCICQAGGEVTEPVGSPVKDSLLAKITDQDTHIGAYLYAPQSAVSPDRLQHWTEVLAAGLMRWCAADGVETRLLA